MTHDNGAYDKSEPCFGCQKTIPIGAPRIHTGLDDALGSLGIDKDPLGLDDILRLAWCEDCTQPGGPFSIEFEPESNAR